MQDGCSDTALLLKNLCRQAVHLFVLRDLSGGRDQASYVTQTILEWEGARAHTHGPSFAFLPIYLELDLDLLYTSVPIVRLLFKSSKALNFETDLHVIDCDFFFFSEHIQFLGCGDAAAVGKACRTLTMNSKVDVQSAPRHTGCIHASGTVPSL